MPTLTSHAKPTWPPRQHNGAIDAHPNKTHHAAQHSQSPQTNHRKKTNHWHQTEERDRKRGRKKGETVAKRDKLQRTQKMTLRTRVSQDPAWPRQERGRGGSSCPGVESLRHSPVHVNYTPPPHGPQTRLKFYAAIPNHRREKGVMRGQYFMSCTKYEFLGWKFWDSPEESLKRNAYKSWGKYLILRLNISDCCRKIRCSLQTGYNIQQKKLHSNWCLRIRKIKSYM